MAAYTVPFENNNAVSARQVNIITYPELKKLTHKGQKVMMEWCIVDAEHETAAIETANTTVKTVWGSILGIQTLSSSLNRGNRLSLNLFNRA